MKFFRGFLALICVAVVVTSIIFGVNQIDSGAKLNKTPTYSKIINLWHVDTFEGGINSRADFLFKETIAFEKENKGVLILVTDHTPKSVEENYKKGIFPDFISYGIGVDIKTPQEINLSKNFIGGNYKNQSYALPWCRGGYAVIGNAKNISEIPQNLENSAISSSGYSQPYLALKLENFTVKDYITLPPLDAYYAFVTGKVNYLVGTQRDINRLNKRDFSYVSKPLESYNDLYQYISITTTDKTKKFYIEKFIERLLSEKVQNKLTRIGMLSAFYEVKSEIENLNELQRVTAQKTLNFLTTKESFSELLAISEKYLQGEIKYEEKIKNMLI